MLAVSTILLVPLLAFALANGARTLRRWQLAYMRKRRSVDRRSARVIERHRLLIVGAGDAGFAISQQIEEFRAGTST